jgi:adhesin HecA-like repeat protein
MEATITIPAGDTVRIPDGVELGGVGNVINNYGTMIITGSYESGMTTVNNYGTILVYGTYVGGMGETHNYGKFVVEPGGLLTLERGQQMYLESGSLTNDGAVYIGVGGNVQWKGGTLTNNGTVNVASNELYRTVNIDYAAYNGAGDLNMLSDEEYNALIDAMSAQADYELIPEKIE